MEDISMFFKVLYIYNPSLIGRVEYGYNVYYDRLPEFFIMFPLTNIDEVLTILRFCGLRTFREDFTHYLSDNDIVTLILLVS